MSLSRRLWLVVALCVPLPFAWGKDPASGWRGNGTGLWPDAKPPVHWYRTPRGALEGLRATANRPADEKPGNAPIVEKGLLRDWLVLGPFPVNDSVKDFDKDLLQGEDKVEPALGDKTAGQTWKSATVPPDDIMVFGTAELPWLDLAKVFGFKTNQVGYAHTYVFSPRGGPARIVVDHGHGLKAWVNGKEAYRSAQRHIGLGFYTSLSTHELKHLDQSSARFDFSLKKGWNRLLLKVSTPNQKGHTDMRCCVRIMDPPDVPYESKNILWMTALPGRSTSTPIIVGDRLFVMAEPDEILCLDKHTGKILWSAAVNFYEALTPKERQAKPAFEKMVDPLIAKLHKEPDRLKRLNLRAEIQKTLLGIDEARFKIAGSGHFEAHFGIVGFTMPTPVSDGKRIFVWSGMGVAACFDLGGKRQWITRLETDEISYGSSPALADGVLVVFLNELFGLDANTGKLMWKQHKIRNNVGAVQGVTLAGQPVIITQRGDIVRPKDGALLFRPRDSAATGDTGWAPPTVLGDLVYSPKHGVTMLNIYDFAGVQAKKWQPKLIGTISTPPEASRGAKGNWLDRWTAGSPLIWDGLVYQTDIYQTLFVSDLKAQKLLYFRPMDLHGFMHYNSVPMAASPTLIGKHIVVQDNQGTALVLQPGREYKVLAKNQIATQLDRRLPLPAQETIGYAPPLADGNRLYLRGEAYMYCIGER